MSCQFAQPIIRQDLFDIYYGDNFERRKKYLDSLATDVLSPQNEEIARMSVSPEYLVEKIPVSDAVSPDFKIESENVVIEVTTYKSEPVHGYFYLTPNQIIQKLNQSLFHIDIKKEGYDRYSLIGFLIIDTIVNSFIELAKKEKFLPFLNQSEFTTLRIEALYVRVANSALYIPSPDGTVSGSNLSTDIYPPFIIINNRTIREKLERLFLGVELVDYVN